jgi:uroporphyrinogen decarboxylase
MNGKERILAALSLEIPDRVPHFELAYNEASIIKIARCFTDDVPKDGFIQNMTLEDKAKLLEAAALMIEKLDVDGITLRIFPETEALGEDIVRDDWGVTFKFSPFGESVVIDGPVRDEADLKRYRPPKIKASDLLTWSYSAERLGPERAMVLSLQCPFRRSWNVLGGMEHLLLYYLTKPASVHIIARMVTDYTLEAIELGASLGADVISLDGDLAYNTNTIMSGEHFREFVKPYYAEIVEQAHRFGLKIFKHTDGNHARITADFLEVGFDGLHPIQPQCMTLAEVKKQIGDQICLMGNIDCMETLVNKGPREVQEEVKQAIAVAAPGGGYILTSSNTIHPGVKAENYIAMVEAVHKHGLYR